MGENRIKTNLITNLSSFSHYLCQPLLNQQAVCVDLTCGNGNDTLFLASQCRKVYGFDIQKQAIENTGKLLKENDFNNVELICDSHSHLLQYINEPIDCFIGNLGYLPNGDRDITTASESTLKALEGALSLLKKNGIICIVAYCGHNQGDEETKMLDVFSRQLDSKTYQAGWFKLANQPKNPPQILLISRKN